MSRATGPLGTLLSQPRERDLTQSRAAAFMAWLREQGRADVATWDELSAWSTAELESFWEAVWDYFGVRSRTPYTCVLTSRVMPGADWFPGAALNYAEHCFGAPEDDDRIAVVAHSQTRELRELTFAQLRDDVRRVRAGLRRLGVGRGDRVAGYLPNCPEALVAFLATSSLGAIWTVCAPEFGSSSVVDRFGQVEPSVLLAVPGYVYGDKPVDRVAEVERIRAALPSVRHLVQVPYGPGDLVGADCDWADLAASTDEPLEFAAVPFDHPLCVLFSSGTTGLPKPIVHGHGGILVEHLKNHALHWDLGPGDRLLWFTTTAWMMWNTLVSALLVRASLVMIDGNPLYPDLRAQWRLAEQTRATLMGASPGYLMACRRDGVRPAAEFDLSGLRQLGAAGSPFPAEGCAWVVEQLGPEVLLNVGSGGTDVCTGLVQASPLTPVWAGEMSGRSLGVDAVALDERGVPVVGEVGELAILSPMPSMPIGFWGDHDGSRFREAYFSYQPGVFRFGDWSRFSDRGSCQITGRSDATLNRGGVRLGTAEFYRVLEDVDEVSDSLVVHLEDPEGGLGELMLFICLTAGEASLDEALRDRLTTLMRRRLSPRHIPDSILAVPAIPYGRTGKKLEVPVKRLLQGAAPDTVVSRGALQEPSSLDAYVRIAHDRRGRAQ